MLKSRRIVAEAGRLPSAYGLRGWTCSTLFGLIAVTGLRVNEALGLDDDDIDLKEGVLTIRRAKNRKRRFVPISPCAAERLQAYRAERNRILGAGRAAFFLLEKGERPTLPRWWSFPSSPFGKLASWPPYFAPTDAGLGQVIVNSPRVPVRIREALNVEAALNDGLSVPFLLFFMAIAAAKIEGGRWP
jgi:hypothetical protein